jgi:hypothetical protein
MLLALTAIRVNEADPQNIPNPLTLAESVSIALSNSSIIKRSAEPTRSGFTAVRAVTFGIAASD